MDVHEAVPIDDGENPSRRAFMENLPALLGSPNALQQIQEMQDNLPDWFTFNDVAVVMKTLHIDYAHSMNIDSFSPRDMMRHLLEIAKIRVRRTKACEAHAGRTLPPATGGILPPPSSNS